MGVHFQFNGVEYDNANDVLRLGECRSNADRIIRLTGFDREFLRKQKLEMQIPVVTMSGNDFNLEMCMDMPKEILELHEGLTREISCLHMTSMEYRNTRPKPSDPPRALTVRKVFNARPRHVRVVRNLIDQMLAQDLPPYFAVLNEKLLGLVAEFMAALEQVGVVPAEMRLAA